MPPPSKTELIPPPIFVLAALGLLVAWLFLQVVISTIFMAGYAISIGQLDALMESPEAAQAMLGEMPVGFLVFMLLTQTVIIWAIILTVSWFSLRAAVPETDDQTRVLGLRRPRGPLRFWFMAPVVGALTYGLAVGVQYLIPGEELNELFQQMIESPLGFAGLLVLAVGLAPICEELFFRGLLYPALRSPSMALYDSLGASGSTGAIISAVVVNSLLFSGVHIATYGFEIGFLLPLFVMSLVMATLREITQSVWPCVLAHLTFNLLSMVLVGADQWIRTHTDWLSLLHNVTELGIL